MATIVYTPVVGTLQGLIFLLEKICKNYTIFVRCTIDSSKLCRRVNCCCKATAAKSLTVSEYNNV